VAICAYTSNGSFVRVAVIDTAEMLRDLSMSASGKLHRSVGGDGEWQQWAGRAQEQSVHRGDAAERRMTAMTFADGETC
jgi:hypothetical protein